MDIKDNGVPGMDDLRVVNGYISAVAEGLRRTPLLSREGWAIAESAVSCAASLSDGWGGPRGGALDEELRRGIRVAADIYSKMIATISGTMPSQSQAMSELLDRPAAVLAQLRARSAQLSSIGPYDADAAREKLDAIVPPDLTAAILAGKSPAIEGLKGALAMVSPEFVAVARKATDKVPRAPEAGAGKDTHEKGSKTMDENAAATTDTAPTEPIYAYVKFDANDVRLTGKTSTAKNGKTLYNAFISIPRGTNVNGIDLTGYEMFTKLVDFQHDKVRDGEPISLRFNEKFPVEVFRGFDEEGQRIDPVELDPWQFRSAVKSAIAAREANRENYARINISREDVHPYVKTDQETGEQMDMACVTLPEGTFTPAGEDISGRNVFLRMSEFNTKDFESGRDVISFSVYKESHITARADRDSGVPGVSVGAAELAQAVSQAADPELEGGEAVDAPEGSLAELESAARAGAETNSGMPPVQDVSAR